MSTDETSRVIDPNRDTARQLGWDLIEYEAKKKAAKKRGYMWKLQPTVDCSKCHRKMKKSIADTQIENKRKDAPICTACVCGYKRKPLLKVIWEQRQKMDSKKFKAFLARIKEQKKEEKINERKNKQNQQYPQ